MKSYAFLFAGLSLLATHTSAHYIFERLTHAGTEYPAYTYIRQNTNYNSPVTALNSTDLRCNVGGETAGSTTTITVNAGDAFSITTDTAVYHDGPFSIYMAKAPTTAAEFDGSGQVWFKIYDLGPTFAADGTSTWPLYQTYSYTIPPALPNGDYLLRFQQLGIHNPWPAGIPQFYVECAQITVTGGGSGTPGPLVSIPGYITGDEPGYTVNIYSNFHNYTIPGPSVWSGQSAAGGSSPSSVASVAPVSTAPVQPVSSSSVAVVQTTSASVVITPTDTAVVAPTGVPVAKYGQCGGTGWTGSTTCASGSTCKATNQYYSQCL
ncbi:uncharacterized protein LY89DRAFT_707156 [Mollisia scopiformis]|uniref:AA9 family lytic polysaccharide monooxygenase n=1 Tax=Mollisia scopiformis TaxID=149040 RepID=A0A194XC45_MOLSC|nr:uncharacterized protein LY89DRAFT_707156 [Mollisia scopiformis]KUJ17734.1 hypothetical protein LY89DRAFT_707156 [Mollisia scopiformis]